MRRVRWSNVALPRQRVAAMPMLDRHCGRRTPTTKRNAPGRRSYRLDRPHLFRDDS
jgi:hypothetical protein